MIFTIFQIFKIYERLLELFEFFSSMVRLLKFSKLTYFHNTKKVCFLRCPNAYPGQIIVNQCLMKTTN